jgi:hypothetical protein
MGFALESTGGILVREVAVLKVTLVGDQRSKTLYFLAFFGLFALFRLFV